MTHDALLVEVVVVVPKHDSGKFEAVREETKWSTFPLNDSLVLSPPTAVSGVSTPRSVGVFARSPSFPRLFLPPAPSLPASTHSPSADAAPHYSQECGGVHRLPYR